MNDVSRELRLGVWGAGVMGARVARAAAALSGVTVAAVIDLDEDRARHTAAQVGATATSSLAAAQGEAGVDAVYIGLPNGLHADACLEAARLGLHVLIDKPLTTTVSDADAVLAAAAVTPAFWMMGFSYRFRAEWREARDIVRRGGIGDVYVVVDDVIEAYRDTPRWYWEAARGGGTLLLQSHHVFDRWEWMLGADVTAVSARTVSIPGVEADLAVALQAQLGPSIIGSSAMSFGVTYDAKPRVAFTVQGTRGMIEIDETRRLIVSTPAGIEERTFDGDDWLATQIADFVAGVRGTATGQPTLRAGRRAVQLADAARRSAAQGAWLAIPPSTADDGRTG